MAISPDVEAALAAMSDGEFSALTAKVRAPDTAQAIRDVAARAGLTAEQIQDRCFGLDPAAFVTNGALDEARVLRTLGVDPNRQQRSEQWSQRGQGGRAAAAKRFGTMQGDALAGDGGAREATTPGGPPAGAPGTAGRAAAAKRFGRTEQR